MDQGTTKTAGLPVIRLQLFSCPACARNLQGSILLDLARLHGYCCDMKAGVSCYLNGIKFSSVKFSRDSLECMRQGSISRTLPGFPKASWGIGLLDPHKVPSRLTDHRIENRRCKVFDHRPVIANEPLEWIQSIWQDAFFTQENGMQLHACALLEAAGTATLLETDSTSIEGVSSPIEQGCLSDSSTMWPGSKSGRPEASPGKPVTSGWLTGRYRCIPL